MVNEYEIRISEMIHDYYIYVAALYKMHIITLFNVNFSQNGKYNAIT